MNQPMKGGADRQAHPCVSSDKSFITEIIVYIFHREDMDPLELYRSYFELMI